MLIFAGAGASRAISPEKYPTTLEFFEKLPAKVTQDELYNAVHGNLVRRNSARSGPESNIVIDIEDILWDVEEVGQSAGDMPNNKSLMGTIWADTKLLDSIKVDGNAIRNAGQNLNVRASALTANINELVYDFYSQTPSEEEIGLAWVPLLRPLLEADEWIDIFTTNYDPVIESCIDWMVRDVGLPPIATGRTDAVQRDLDLMNWDATSTDMRRRRGYKGGGILTKLHGSIDWLRRENTIYIGAPVFSGDHRSQVIIYPGHKGRELSPPFDLFHEYFGRVISEARDLVFIGFAFRDDSINEILRSRISPEARIHTINPSGPPHDRIPFEVKRVQNIDDGFDSQSVSRLLHQMKSV